MAKTHQSDPPTDGAEQHEQLPGQPGQGNGGRGVVRVCAPDQRCQPRGQWPVRVSGVGAQSHNQQQDDSSQRNR